MTSFVVLADGDDEATRALRPWRGLRTPGRLAASSPVHLREYADRLGRDWLLARYRRVSEPHRLLGPPALTTYPARPRPSARDARISHAIRMVDPCTARLPVDRPRRQWAPSLVRATAFRLA